MFKQREMTPAEIKIAKEDPTFRKLSKAYKKVLKDDILLWVMKLNQRVYELEQALAYLEGFVEFCNECKNPSDDCICTIELVEEYLQNVEDTLEKVSEDADIELVNSHKERLTKKLKKLKQLAEIEKEQKDEESSSEIVE